jgi:hypothetical protein
VRVGSNIDDRGRWPSRFLRRPCKADLRSPRVSGIAFTIEAPRFANRPHQNMAYHTCATASADELCGRAEWTLDRVMKAGFPQLLASQTRYMDEFWRRSDVQVREISKERTKRTTVEVQQAIRFNLFHILQTSARAEHAGVPAKGLTPRASPLISLGPRRAERTEITQDMSRLGPCLRKDSGYHRLLVRAVAGSSSDACHAAARSNQGGPEGRA